MPAADLSGAILDGRYKVLEPIAEGAMGVVYKAERLKLGRIVAIKVLHDELPNELSSRKRFEIEAMAMAKLEHPHCAAVLDVGMHEDKPFVVMDFVSGQDLKAVIAQGPVPLARAVEIVRQVLTGLAHAHELGIIHRDIKPANIILGHKAGLGDHVKILDFGLARLHATQSSHLTSGIVVGTPAYMAPEQIRGVVIDARADLYACGVLLMELLTGRKPFYSESDDPIEVVTMHLKNPPPTLAELSPGTDFGELEPIVARALAKSADDRYQSAQEFVTALELTQKRAVSPTATTEPAGKVIDPDASIADQISDSMMIPSTGTRLGMVAVKADDSVPMPIAKASSARLGPKAFVRPDTPIPEPDPTPLTSPRIPSRLETDPFEHVTPVPVTAMKVRPRNPGGLPFSKRQLQIGGGGLLGLVVLIALIGNHCSGKSAPAVASAPVAPTEIEMEPSQAGGATKVLARAAELAAAGQREAAITLLAKARATYPEDPDIPYQAGRLYFDKLWWTDGLKNLRDAIQIDPTFKDDPDLIKLVLKGFITTPSYNDELGSFLRTELGASAVPYLEETARSHPNAGKRARAAAELKRIQ